MIIKVIKGGVMDNSQWLSVKDIVSKYKKFNVPSLQRTYRW